MRKSVEVTKADIMHALWAATFRCRMKRYPTASRRAQAPFSAALRVGSAETERVLIPSEARSLRLRGAAGVIPYRCSRSSLWSGPRDRQGRIWSCEEASLPGHQHPGPCFLDPSRGGEGLPGRSDKSPLSLQSGRAIVSDRPRSVSRIGKGPRGYPAPDRL